MTDLIKLRESIDNIITDDADKPATAEDLTLQLADLHGKQQELLKKLHQALLIKKWQPDAFDHGSIKIAFIGAPGASLKTWQMRMRLGDGTVRMFPVTEVPDFLLPANIKKALKTPLKRLPREEW